MSKLSEWIRDIGITIASVVAIGVIIVLGSPYQFCDRYPNEVPDTPFVQNYFLHCHTESLLDHLLRRLAAH